MLQLRELTTARQEESQTIDLRVVVVDTGSTTLNDRRNLVEIVDTINSENVGVRVHLLYDPLQSLGEDSSATPRARNGSIAPPSTMATQKATRYSLVSQPKTATARGLL